MRLEESRHGLETIIEAITSLTQLRGAQRFADGVFAQLSTLLGVEAEGLACAQVGSDIDAEMRVIAGAGEYAALVDKPLRALPEEALRQRLERCLNLRQNI